MDITVRMHYVQPALGESRKWEATEVRVDGNGQEALGLANRFIEAGLAAINDFPVAHCRCWPSLATMVESGPHHGIGCRFYKA